MRLLLSSGRGIVSRPGATRSPNGTIRATGRYGTFRDGSAAGEATKPVKKARGAWSPVPRTGLRSSCRPRQPLPRSRPHGTSCSTWTGTWRQPWGRHPVAAAYSSGSTSRCSSAATRTTRYPAARSTRTIRRTGRSVRRVHHDDSHRDRPASRRLLTEPVHDRTDRVLDPRQVPQVVIEPDLLPPVIRCHAVAQQVAALGGRPRDRDRDLLPKHPEVVDQEDVTEDRVRRAGNHTAHGAISEGIPSSTIPATRTGHQPRCDVGPSSAPGEAPSDRGGLFGSQLPARLTTLGEPAELCTEEHPDLTVGAPELSGQVLGSDDVVHGGSLAPPSGPSTRLAPRENDP